MEVRTEKNKITTNSTNNISADIIMNSQKLAGGGEQFRIPGSNLSEDGTWPADIRIRIASTMTAKARLNRILAKRHQLRKQVQACKSLIISILVYGCEKWTQLSDWKKRIQTRPSARGNFSAFPTRRKRPTIESGARSTSLLANRNLFWQLSRDGNSHGSCMSRATTASPKLWF